MSTSATNPSLLWRVHFWAALIASPFAVLAALTGILYIFTPQIEAQLQGHLDTVAPAGVMRPLDDVVRAANAAAPQGWVLHSLSPAHEPTDSARCAFQRNGRKASAFSAAEFWVSWQGNGGLRQPLYR